MADRDRVGAGSVPPDQIGAATQPSGSPGQPATEHEGQGPDPQGPARRRPAKPRPKWWKRPWVVPLVLACVIFLAFSAPPFFMFDYHQVGTITFRPGIESYHYALVSLHVAFGTIALLAVCLQVWPWFRQRYPVVHRRVGRTYVFAGVLPSAFFGVFTAILQVQGLTAQIGNLLLVSLWGYTTWTGYRCARARNFGEHRKWMIRSFALCFSIVLNRLWVWITMPIALAVDPIYQTEQAAEMAGAGAAVWLSWIVNLLVAEWWLQYRGKKKARGHTTARAASSADRGHAGGPDRQAPPAPAQQAAPAAATTIVPTVPPADDPPTPLGNSGQHQ